MDQRSDSHLADDSGHTSERLESWKAIARYLGRTVRTAHRWEKEEGLPVRRHLHRSQSTVYAYASEIDAWWEARAGAPRASARRNPKRMRLLAAALLLAALLVVATEWRAAPDRLPVMPDSIAVLPFRVLAGSDEDRRLGHAIAEELLNRLSQVSSMTIIARTSSFAFEDGMADPVEIASLLGVDHLLLGTLQRDDGQLRINARLVDSRGRQVWARSFDRYSTDLFTLQDDVAGAVLSSVAPHVAMAAGETIAPDPDAYQQFLIGREYLRAGEVDTSIAYLRRALATDVNFTPALGMLAWAVAEKSRHLVDRTTYDEAIEAAQRALQSDPDSATAHLALGIVSFEMAQPERAIESIERSLASDPKFVDARLWLSRARQGAGRLPESDDDLALALQMDPLHPIIIRELAARHWARGDYTGARELLVRLLGLPHPPQPTWMDLVALSREFGKLQESLDWARRAAVAAPRFAGLGSMIQTYDRLGMFEEADFWLEQLAVAEQGVPRLGLRSEDLYVRGRFEEVLRLKSRYVDRSGMALDRLPFAVQETLGSMLIVAGRIDEGIEILEPWFQQDFELQGHLRDYPLTLSFAQMLVYGYQVAGRDRDADSLLARIDEHLEGLRAAGLDARPNVDLVRARQAALRGQREVAVGHVHRAVGKGWRDVAFERQHPAWHRVTGDEQLRAAFAVVMADISELRSKLQEQGPDQEFRDSIAAILYRPQ